MHLGAQEGHLIGLGCRTAAPYMLVSAAILAHPSGLGRACPFPLHPCLAVSACVLCLHWHLSWVVRWTSPPLLVFKTSLLS